MTIYTELHSQISGFLIPLANDNGLDPEALIKRFVVEAPRDASHGELTSNVAMVSSKTLNVTPRDLAEHFVTKFKSSTLVASVEIAGPGFLNFRLHEPVWFEFLKQLIENPQGTLKPQMAKGERINIEYVSANPTGPMHVGHGRGAVYGQALANLLAFVGYNVTREYYINDAGSQVDVLARSTYLRYREALGEDIGSIPEGLYPGDYLKPVGEALAKTNGNMLMGMPEEKWIEAFRKKAIDMMMDSIREDLALLNIRHDVFFSERSLINPKKDCVAAAIEDLRQKGVVYEGVLPRPKGTDDEEWEEREQTLFRSTQFGDDVDRALLKSDGGYTYFASDIAYHNEKFMRGFSHMIDVWGADHGGYVKRMQSAIAAISGGKARLDVELCQMVRLMRNGEVVKMSKRSGDFVTLREVVEEVGADAVCFMMLMRKQDAALDFDLVKVKEQSKDNPVFYVQYAHARCHSTLRQAALNGLNASGADVTLLVDESEKALIQFLAQFSRVIEQAVSAREPHRVAFYLYDLASHFHAHWNKGKDFPELRFVTDNAPLSQARLALVSAIAEVLRTGLELLGVSAPEEMR